MIASSCLSIPCAKTITHCWNANRCYPKTLRQVTACMCSWLLASQKKAPRFYELWRSVVRPLEDVVSSPQKNLIIIYAWVTLIRIKLRTRIWTAFWSTCKPFNSNSQVFSLVLSVIVELMHWGCKHTFIVRSKFFFSLTILSKGERRNEVNPMWSTNPWNKVRPQHRERRALLFAISVWVL